MRLSLRALSLALATVALLAAFPGVVLAKPLTDCWDTASVTLADLAFDKEPTFIIRLQLKEKYHEPPAEEVAIELPKDSDVLWVGELLGGDGSNDVDAEEPHIVKIDGKKYIAFKIAKSPRVQLECTVPKGTVSGPFNNRDISVKWTPAAALSNVQMAVIAPQGIAAVSPPEGLEVLATQTGETAYVKTVKKAKGGKELEFALKLRPGTPKLTSGPGSEASKTAESTGTATATAAPAQPVAPAATQPAPRPISPITWVLLALGVALLAAVGGLVYMLQRGNAPATELVTDEETSEITEE